MAKIDPEGLSCNQYEAIAALLISDSKAVAARAAGVSRKTIYRYLAEPAFLAELHKQQDAVLEGVVAELVGLAEDSIDVIKDIMWDDEATHRTRLRAAIAGLMSTSKYMEIRMLTNRIKELEERVG